MNLIRFILLALLAWILWHFYKRWRYNKALQKVENDTHTVPKNTMVSCHYCQLYLPKDEAYQDGEFYYCCKKHQAMDHKK